MRIFLKYWLPVILYACIIFLVSSIPGSEIPRSPFLPDYLLHVLEYLPLGLLTCRAVKFSKNSISMRKVFILSVLLVLIYGVSDEFHQSFVPGRCVSILDLLCDVVGATIGIKFAA